MSFKSILIIILGLIVLGGSGYLGYSLLGNLGINDSGDEVAPNTVSIDSVNFDYTISTSPRSIDLVKNEGIEVEISLMGNLQNLEALDLAMSYDPKEVRVEYIESGSLFEFYAEKEIDETKGYINVAGAGLKQTSDRAIIKFSFIKLIDGEVEILVDGFNLTKQVDDRMTQIVVGGESKVINEQKIVIN